jgi:hypothetical protein
MPQEAQACLAGAILDVARSQQDAGIAQQHLSGRVPRRGRDPRPHARGSVRELAAVRPPAAGPPSGAVPHASRSCIQCRPGSPMADARKATAWLPLR